MTPVNDNPSATTMVIGASRGLGRGIATAFAGSGGPVVAVARSESALRELADSVSGIRAEVADAGDATIAGRLLDRYDPRNVVIVAGATPLMRPIQQQTWEAFSVNWQTDVKVAFNWVREALLRPLRPGSRVVVISSGAALAGSPLSGGYAGAKGTQRFIASYAQDESQLAGLEVTFTAVLPQITSATELGRPAVEVYAARSGKSVEEYLAQFGEVLTPDAVGRAVVELTELDPGSVSRAYRLTSGGLQPLS